MRQFLEKYRELLLYGLFGGGTVAVDMGLYSLLVGPFGIAWANAWAWCGAVAFAFFTNKYFVFARSGQEKGRFWRELAEFIGARLLSLLVEVWGVEYLVERGLHQTILGITGGAAKGIITLVVILMNYLISKLLIFRPREARP